MHKLRHSTSDSHLPFFVARSPSSRSSFRFIRFWRSLPRLPRTLLVIVASVACFGFVYGLVASKSTSSSHDAKAAFGSVVEQPSRPNQVALPPQIQQEAGGGNNGNDNNNNVDFDEMDGGKRLAEAEIAQRNAAPAEAPREGNIAEPKYPIFRGPQNERQQAVVDAFKFAWKGYKEFAWGHDQLRPVSGGFSEWFGTGLTIVDSLDTILIMGLTDEFAEAREWVKESLSFDRNVFVSFFETTIRMLGGLLSAFHLSGDRLFVERATDLGERLAGAFGTKSPIPSSDVNLQSRSGRQPSWGADGSLSEATTVQLEFRDLARIIDNSTLENLSFRTSEHIHKIGCAEHDGLCGMFLNSNTGSFRGASTITLGARADSYYEYLLKQWLQTGKTIDWLRDDYNSSVAAMQKHLIRKTEPNKYTFVGELLGGATFSAKMDHLACFLGGALALGTMNGLPAFHLELGKEIGRGCQRMYQTPTGLGPEIIHFNMLPGQGDDISIKELDAHCLLRPEAFEAWFYLYRATGDKTYQEWGWSAFQAIEKHAKVAHGYSSVNNVKRVPVSYRDLMESFFLAETLKYLYLLFADDQSEIPLSKYVFNTEGHPLPIYDR